MGSPGKIPQANDFKRNMGSRRYYSGRKTGSGCQEGNTILWKIITAHAIPVGSGTVARAQRIPIDKRAQAAVIAWMRHKTTAYDSMKIPHVKGKRREVRRYLAQKSIEVLEIYRHGQNPKKDCPLQQALKEDYNF